MLASVRIGDAEVDTLVPDGVVYPGESFEARIRVRGGDVTQEIEGLELQLVANVQEEHSDIGQSKLIERWGVVDAFTIGPGEEEIVPFEGRLHPETPVTTVEARRNLAQVWLQTGLAIDAAIDAEYTDYLEIAPTSPMEAMLDVVDRSGFYLDKISIDRERVGGVEWRADLALDQEFEFKPQGRSRSKFDKVELHFVPRDEKTRILLEFERPHRTETFRTMTIEHDDIDVDAITSTFQDHLDDV
jgi:sporulation-control protein